jgi:hypothetical protein
MKRGLYLFLLFIIIVLCVNQVFSTCIVGTHGESPYSDSPGSICDKNGKEITLKEADLSDSTQRNQLIDSSTGKFKPEFITSTPSIYDSNSWKKEYTSFVPSGYIETIPKNKVDIDLADPTSELTTEQVLANKVDITKLGFKIFGLKANTFWTVVLDAFGIETYDPDSKANGKGFVLDDNENLDSMDMNFEKENTMTMPNPLSNSKAYIGDDGVSYVKGFPDSDNDGLADDFEANNGLDKASKDSDGDGLTDYDEYHKYPTNPKKYNTYPEYGLKNDKEFVEALMSGKITSLFFNGVDLISFLGLSPSTMFKDSDGDGISDINEYIYGYDYNNKDSDKDGYNDGFELSNGLNPLQETTLEKDSSKDNLVDIDVNAGGSVSASFPEDSMTFNLNNANLQIKGENSNFIDFRTKDTSKQSTVTVTKTGDGAYDISTINGKNIIYSNGYTEEINGNSIKYNVNLDDGVTYVELDSPGE